MDFGSDAGKRPTSLCCVVQLCSLVTLNPLGILCFFIMSEGVSVVMVVTTWQFQCVHLIPGVHNKTMDLHSATNAVILKAHSENWATNVLVACLQMEQLRYVNARKKSKRVCITKMWRVCPFWSTVHGGPMEDLLHMKIYRAHLYSGRYNDP